MLPKVSVQTKAAHQTMTLLRKVKACVEVEAIAAAVAAATV
jgi:hypothetical protein